MSRGNMTDMKKENNPGNPSTGAPGAFFEIHIKGRLDDSWSEWLDGLEVKVLENDETILFGPIGDQAALMGVLNRLYGLNLALLSVREVHPKK
jgi:hypothetical protein